MSDAVKRYQVLSVHHQVLSCVNVSQPKMMASEGHTPTTMTSEQNREQLKTIEKHREIMRKIEVDLVIDFQLAEKNRAI